MLDDKGKLIRTFEICNVNQNQRLHDSWLATPFLHSYSAHRIFVTLRFSVRDCTSLRSPSPTCRETLTLYYRQADSQRELERTWSAEVRATDLHFFNIEYTNQDQWTAYEVIGFSHREACWKSSDNKPQAYVGWMHTHTQSVATSQHTPTLSAQTDTVGTRKGMISFFSPHKAQSRPQKSILYM